MTQKDTLPLLFQVEIELRCCDINYGGHLGNDRFLTLVQDARAKFFHSKGWTEKKLAQTNCGLVVTKASIDFLSEAFLGDTLLVDIFLSKKEHCRFEFYYTLINKKSKKIIGKVWTQLAFFDYERRKVTKCPEFYEALELM